MSSSGPDIERSFFLMLKVSGFEWDDGINVAKGLPTLNATYVKVITCILAGIRYVSLRNTPSSYTKATKEATANFQRDMSLPE